uniref:Uncharacterized protein n=1 Tax=Magallana gigas TaxID=29159 RepID=A0A8W8IXL1_MAGGI
MANVTIIPINRINKITGDLVEYGHITWINPGFKASSIVFSELVHKSEDPGVLIIGQSADYSTFAVTNPGMYKYLAVNRTDLNKFLYIEKP